MIEGPHLTAQVRERAVLAVLEAMSITSVSSAYGVDRKTVSRWVAKLRAR
jgi:transposase